MLKVHFQSWELKELAIKNQLAYEQLREVYPKLKNHEEALTGYQDELECYVNSLEELPDWFLEIAARKFEVIKPLKLMTSLGSLSAEGLKNAVQRAQVHLPGNELMQIRDVCVLSDSCTDALKDEIDKGWRILAICPQPGQRRPDYVLGKP